MFREFAFVQLVPKEHVSDSWNSERVYNLASEAFYWDKNHYKILVFRDEASKNPWIVSLADTILAFII